MLGALQRVERGTITGSLIFLIADLNREIQSLESTLGRLCQRHTLVIIPVDDIADRELPKMGRALFTDPSGELIEIDTNDQAGREEYSRHWQENRQSLLSVANGLGIPVIPVDTDSDVHQALVRGMRLSARTRVLR
jgi:uncharacterized protein (DUF58 family)